MKGYGSRSSSVLGQSGFSFSVCPLVLKLGPLGEISAGALSAKRACTLSVDYVFALSLSGGSEVCPYFSLSASSDAF